jgi:predicted enzyme related to lactoylglutathione lyase
MNKQSPRPVHFEIMAEDPARAKKFYEDVFGWEFKKWEAPEAEMDYWLIKTGEKGTMGIDGGLGKRDVAAAKGGPNSYAITIGVSNFDEYQKKILAAGGTVMRPKYEIPKVGQHGFFYDTEGIMFGILEPSGEMGEM